MPKIESLYQVKSVNIDFPFAQKNDFRPDGKLATSFVTIKEEIDRALVLGFNTISFDTNVPINPLTGELMLRVGDNLLGNNDKSFSDEVWKGIEYAESLGLRTIIDLHIRNAYNDEAITNTNVGPNFDFKKFFAAVNTFEVDLAKKAQQYGVDGFQIGSFNFGVVDAAYFDNWSSLVNSIRAVYSGTLRYNSNLEDLKNPLWNLVDEIQLSISPVWSLKDTYTAQDIANLYLSSYTMGNGKISTMSVNDRLDQYTKLYPGKSISLEVSFKPGQSAGHESVNPWGYVYDFSITGDGIKNANSLKVFPDAWIDYDLNSQKIAGFLEYFGNHLKNSISGVQYWQYMPWTEANWIRAPMNLEGQVWQSITRAGDALNWNPAAEQMLQTYLAKGWGFHFINYGTSSQDNLFGSSYNDTFVSSRGSDVIDGGAGKDTVTVSNLISNYSVTKTASGYTFLDKTGLDGTDTLLNIEAIKFTDKTINLTVQAKAASAPPADVTRLVELYTAFFNRVPDADGMSFWIDEMKSGKTIIQVAESFYNAGVNYSSLTGFTTTMKNTDFINVIYKNVLGRKDGADAGGLSFWDGALTSGQASRGTLVTNILDSAHTFKGDKTWGWVADLLDNKITVAKKFSIDMGLNYNTPEESITKGMAIASAITSTDTSAAVTLIGVTEANLGLT
jgi:hypothetical protein